jgi:hypothetical protein
MPGFFLRGKFAGQLARFDGQTAAGCFFRVRDALERGILEAIQLLLETERAEVFRLDPQAETAELVLA